MLFTCLVAAMIGADADTLKPGDFRRTVMSGGIERNYLVHVPPGYDGKKPMPVVLIFHGGGSNAAMTVRYTGLNEKGDAAGFLAVYPNGTGRLARALTWNAGNCCGYAQRQQIDDVGYVSALLDDLEKAGHVDRRRIFATGISNGGMMSYRLAAELSDRIAAIAPVAGTLGIETVKPSRPVPVLHFHGTDDQFLPFKGGRGVKSLTETIFHPVEDTLETWVKINGCLGQPKSTQLPHVAKDEMRVIRREYGPGKSGAEVVLYLIEGGGHTWPGRQPHREIEFLGPSTEDISANDLMWSFFEKHPLPK
ncbi:MAG: prolyl oligopeptidase family serine peptidase [Planctomycetales bacterium]|nr:prolyl oligopeptidase family serine peptidase [Planctomycetales bacterium]